MSESCDKLIQGAEINNSYSIHAVNDILSDVTRHSYQYLHQLQASSLMFEQFHYHYDQTGTYTNTPYIRDYYRNDLFEICIDLNYNLFDSVNTYQYRNSKYYLQRVSYEEVLKEEVIFNRVPLLIINNRVVTDMELLIEDCRITFILKEVPNLFVSGSLNTFHTHDIIILLINHPHYLETDRMAYDTWTYTDPITTIPSQFNLTLDPSMLTIGWFEYWKTSSSPSTGSMLSFVTKDENEELQIEDVTDEVIESLKTSYTIKFHLLQIPRLYSYSFSSGLKSSPNALKYYEKNEMIVKTEPIVLIKDTSLGYEVLDHPVPVSSFLLWKQKRNSSEWILLSAQESLTLHYPNIYVITDPTMETGDKYRCQYFYRDQTYEEREVDVFTPKEDINWVRYCHNKYKNRHLFFYRFLYHRTNMSQKQIVKELYLNIDTFLKLYLSTNQDQIKRFKEVWEILFQYKWYVHNTDITDYSHLYFYNELKRYEDKEKEPLEYKVDKMWEFIYDDDDVLHQYVKHQNVVGESHFLFANTTHMKERIRTDCFGEIKNGYEFEEEMYLFEFEEYTTTHPFEIRVFVDGLFAHRAIIEHQATIYYLYIPVSMFEWDSYCEIELFPSFQYKQELNLESVEDVVEIDLRGLFSKKIQPTIADLYVTLSKTDQTMFSDSFFKIVSVIKDIEVPYCDEDGLRYKEFSPMRHYKISLTDPVPLKYSNQFMMRFDKTPYLLDFVVREDGMPILSLEGLKFKPRNDYIRIYRNGRLMTPGCFMVTYRTRPIVLQFFVECKKGDVLAIDITPYKYKEIFYTEELIRGNFLLDVSEYITKPFCNKYYDVYVNGRKMCWNSVFAITPTQLTFVNLHSTKNIQIFEIERDDEYFGLDYRVIQREYGLSDFLKENFITESDLNQIIRDRIQDDKHPDLVIREREMDEETEERYDPDDWYKNMLDYYYDELIPKGFADPDLKQSDHEYVKEQFPVIGIHYFIRNNCIMLDPDIIVKGDDPSNHLFYTYGANENLI